MSTRNQLRHKAERRFRRKRHIRAKVFGTPTKPRLTVFRSHKNISCQVIDDFRGCTLASASTLTENVRAQVQGKGGNRQAATLIGTAIAEKVKALGIDSAQFDRNGYRFHGRIKALVEAARKAGLKI